MFWCKFDKVQQFSSGCVLVFISKHRRAQKSQNDYSLDKPCDTFDEIQKLIAGEIYSIDIETWDGAITLGKGANEIVEKLLQMVTCKSN